MSRRLILASGNRHKIGELAQMLAQAEDDKLRGLEAVGVGELAERLGPSPAIAETADSFAGNAVLKAQGIAEWLAGAGAPTEDLVLADDSGLCVDLLDGRPGVHSARFAGRPGDDAANNAELVAQLRARGREASPAHYVCVLALRAVGGAVELAPAQRGAVELVDGCLCIEGRCGGEVRSAARGEGGFGYDPHFWIDDGARTMAELTRAAKARRSHRGAAMRSLLELLVALL